MLSIALQQCSAQPSNNAQHKPKTMLSTTHPGLLNEEVPLQRSSSLTRHPACLQLLAELPVPLLICHGLLM